MPKTLVDDELWAMIEPLLPAPVPRRFRYPGRRPLSNRQVLEGILFVLRTGIRWAALPQELGYCSGMSCWRRLDAWQRAGVWDQLHEVLLARLRGIATLIARRGEPHSSGLGKTRWVVERTIGWLHNFRRLRVRFERLAHIHEAFLKLARCLICWSRLQNA